MLLPLGQVRCWLFFIEFVITGIADARAANNRPNRPQIPRPVAGQSIMRTAVWAGNVRVVAAGTPAAPGSVIVESIHRSPPRLLSNHGQIASSHFLHCTHPEMKH